MKKSRIPNLETYRTFLSESAPPMDIDMIYKNLGSN